MPKLSDGTVAKNKLKIERAARKLFTRQGFHGTTVREIAQHAGVSMGKLYLYYPAKEDIFIDLVQRMSQKMEAIREKELLPLMQSPDPESLAETGHGGRPGGLRKPGLLAADVHRRGRVPP